jgi:hypothetical protein
MVLQKLRGEVFGVLFALGLVLLIWDFMTIGRQESRATQTLPAAVRP